MVLYLRQGKSITRRHVFMTLLICLIIAVSHLAAIWLRLGWGTSEAEAYDWTAGLLWLQNNWIALAGSMVVYALVFYAGGMYEPPVRRRRGAGIDFLPLATVFISASLVGLVFYAGSGEQAMMGRGIWGIASLLTLVLSYVMRGIHVHLIDKGHFRRRALVLADGDRGVEAVRQVMRHATVPLYHVLGVVRCDVDAPPADPAAGPSATAPDPMDLDAPWPVLGRLDTLEGLVDDRDIAAVLVELSPNYPPAILNRLRHLRYSGVAILDHVGLCEQLVHEIPLSHINEQWLMASALNSSVVQIHHLKRAVDVLLSLVALVPGLPLMAIGALLVKLTSKGPAFYRQVRVGLGGKLFTICKLRTMRTDAEAAGAVWAVGNDSRVTPVGRYLRKWRLDEIPQVLNILRGDMSWVGPRPERPEFTKKLAEVIPFYDERHLVQPGLTGWAQVCYPYGASVEAAARKLQYDLYYIKNMTILLDFSILLRTCRTILVGLAHEDDEDAADAMTLAEIVGDQPVRRDSAANETGSAAHDGQGKE